MIGTPGNKESLYIQNSSREQLMNQVTQVIWSTEFTREDSLIALPVGVSSTTLILCMPMFNPLYQLKNIFAVQIWFWLA